MELLGDKLRRLRIEKKLSIIQVASLIDRARTTINAYESGRSMPSANVIRKLAALYGVTTDYLLGISEKSSPTFETKGLTEEQRQVLFEINQLTLKFIKLSSIREE